MRMLNLVKDIRCQIVTCDEYAKSLWTAAVGRIVVIYAGVWKITLTANYHAVVLIRRIGMNALKHGTNIHHGAKFVRPLHCPS